MSGVSRRGTGGNPGEHTNVGCFAVLQASAADAGALRANSTASGSRRWTSLAIPVHDCSLRCGFLSIVTGPAFVASLMGRLGRCCKQDNHAVK